VWYERIAEQWTLSEQLQNLPVEGLDGASVRAMQVAVDAGKAMTERLLEAQEQMSSEATDSLLSSCRQDLAEKTCLQLEEQMEGMQLQVEKCKHAVSANATTAKERTRYRSKGADLKAQLVKIVEQYNICRQHGRRQRAAADLDSILLGDFPWVDLDAPGDEIKSSIIPGTS